VELVGSSDSSKGDAAVEAGGDAGGESYNSTSFEDYLRIVHAENKVHGKKSKKVGVIVASGEILDGSQPPGVVGGDTVAGLIRTAREDEDVRAILLRVDSPGGSLFASEKIYREVRAAQAQGKPVVVSMGDLAASGGYYIAASADEIWAHPATITGSIGIFGAIPTFQNTLKKIGVSVDGVGTTHLSGQLRLDRPMGEDVKVLLQSFIERGYEEFLAHVAEGRDKSREEVHAIAQGRVWIGTVAKDNGLVDHLGLYRQAVDAAAKLANLGDDYDVQRIEPELSWAESLALQIKVWFAKNVAGDIAARIPALQVAREFEPIQRELARWSRMNARDNRYAYCFCDVR
jgi:protease-4